jgi:sugar lactone lactonase YvrE
VTTTYAGNWSTCGLVDGPKSTAELTTPAGLVVDSEGNIYFAELTNHVLRKITNSTRAYLESIEFILCRVLLWFGCTDIVTTVVGSSGGFVDGVGTSVRLYQPEGVAISSTGIIYIADTATIRAYDPTRSKYTCCCCRDSAT